MSTFTTSVPYNMRTADLSDVSDGTVTFTSSSEVDVTGASGAHYVLTGVDMFGFNGNGVPFRNVFGLSINGGQTAIVNMLDGAFNGFGWKSLVGPGSNSVTGSSGDDVLVAGEDGRSTLYGNGGNDTLIAGQNGDDVLVSGRGNDTFESAPGSSATADFRHATAAVNLDLKVVANGTVDVAGLGHDTLENINGLGGSKFDDTLMGDSNNNTLIGNGGFDHLSGNTGDDTFIVQSANVRLNGGPGFDTVIFRGATGITADLADYKSVESVQGTNAGDTITGTDHNETFSLLAGDDVIHAGGGRDTIIASTGTDLVDGGAGSDTLDFSRSHVHAITIDLSDSSPQAIGADNGTETIISVENVIGTHQSDTITGNASANNLSGGPNGGGGHDIIDGGAGNDTIYGGFSGDTMTGGAGADSFFYTGGDDSFARDYDTITDFNSSQDHIEIESAINSVTHDSGDFDSAHFAAELAHAFPNVTAHNAILLAVTSGDLAGQTFLLMNYTDQAFAASNCLCIHFGSDSNLAGFGTQDFIL